MTLSIAWFGASLVSTHRNGAAMYCRGVIRALAERGHEVTFFEPDVLERRQHRDLDEPPWANIVTYPPSVRAVYEMLERARDADLVIKASDIGIHDALLERAVLDLRSPRRVVAFWDLDAPPTFTELIPQYDIVFARSADALPAYDRRGAKRCVAIHPALDATVHQRVDPDPRFTAALAALEPSELFFDAASRLPERTCLVGYWDDRQVPNVRYLGHVHPYDHNAFYSTPLGVLNVGRDGVFDAAGAAACVITNAWYGLERFFDPGSEILVADSGAEIADHVRALTPKRARAIGARSFRRILAQHTYAHRARDFELALGVGPATLRRHRSLSIVMLGRSITSSWCNDHAATYRGLARELSGRGHRVTFLERDALPYADHRDLDQAPWARIGLYASLVELQSRFAADVRDADLAIVGSYVADGTDVARWVLDTARGKTAFYDLDPSITLSGRSDYLDVSALLPRFDLYLSCTGGPALARVESTFGARRAVPLYRCIDLDVYGPEVGASHWDLGYVGAYRADRQPAVRSLLIDAAGRAELSRFVVAGSQYPAEIDWPPNVERIDHVAPSEARAFYGRLGFALDLGGAHLFEAAACGVAIISDPWAGLGDLFDLDDEILVAHDTDDVLRFLRDTPEVTRRAIGARACARVRATHTAAHRAADLERYARS